MKSHQPNVVSLGDLGQLTMRANVAFAVRCAQRLRPSFELPADAPRRREQLAALDAAIRIAAAFCRGLPGEPGQAAAAARAAWLVADDASAVTGFAGYGAVRAAEAAANAELVLRNPSDGSVTEVVAAAFGAGRVLASNADAFTLDLVAAVLYADVEKLVNPAHGTCEDLGPPIDPSESGPLGPLWPAGVPACFAPAAQQPPRAGE